MRQIVAVLLSTNLCANAFAETSFPGWTLLTETDVSTHYSESAADGRRSLVIESKAASQLTKESWRGTISNADFGWIDELYVLQTVSARDLRGKHIHVSAYLRVDQSRTKRLIDQYKDLLARVPFSGLYRSDWFDRLIGRSASTLVVFLHRADDIREYWTTSEPVGIADSWRRLNVEVGVDSNVQAITIGFFQTGVGVANLDHFAVVEHGDSPADEGSPVSAGLVSKLRMLQEKARDVYEFSNLSFEDEI